MQDHSWDDLRFVLAVFRAGTLAGAGRIAGANETTGARRLKSLERRLQVELFRRTGAGRFEATEVGQEVIRHAERIEHENAAIGETAGRLRQRLVGSVRITSVPIIAHRILLPHLPWFRQANPGLTVELVPDARNLSLSKREADLAIRFARPETGGLTVKARRLGVLAFGVYGPAAASAREAEALEWIGYDDAHLHLPQARWLAAAAAAGGDSGFPALRVSDAETALEAVASGLGRTVLPVLVGEADRRLRRVPGDFADLPVRDVWLLSHKDQDGRASVDAAKAWISGIGWS